MDDLPSLVAAGAVATVDGRWQRHVSVKYAGQALDGRKGYGRWGTADGFPVLYLGQPFDSVVVEAYRHLIDPLEDEQAARELAQHLSPRALVTCHVHVSDVLDLRRAATRVQIGLGLTELRSDTNDRDAYARCQQIAQVAHQLGRHGIIAPAATGLGDTLALFPDLLPAQQQPQRSEDDEIWRSLPRDPRGNSPGDLRLVRP